jgi:hypothetical protein
MLHDYDWTLDARLERNKAIMLPAGTPHQSQAPDHAIYAIATRPPATSPADN